MVTTSKRAAIVVSSVACACALLATEDARAIPIAQLTLDSQPGDFIGQGLDFDITYIPTPNAPISHRQDIPGSTSASRIEAVTP